MVYTVEYLKLFFPSLLTGILFVLSIAPFDLWFLAYLAFVPLLYCSYNATYIRVIALYTSSAIIISTGWWHSVISYSFLIFCLITSVMCLSFIIWGVLTKYFRDKFPGEFTSIFITVLIWVGIERIHTSELVGVPGNLGITQYSQPLLIQSSSLFGIYAVSFLLLLSNSILAYLLLMFNKPETRTGKAFINMALGLTIIISNLIYGYIVLQGDKYQQAPIKIAVVQPVIASEVYQNSWRNPENRLFMKNTFYNLTSRAIDADVDVIFWPEGGNGYLNMRIPELRENLYRIAKDNNVNLVISSDDLDDEGKKYNSIFSISSNGMLLDRYDKVKLIPDAEAGYTPGHGYKPVNTSFGLLAGAICYETNFPSIFRTLVDQGARILFASTSDAAFKRTSLVLSHSNLSVFRAIENRRWMVHASNTGVSIIVSPSGNIIEKSSLYKRQIITSQINALDEKSVFTRYGYIFPEILALSIVLIAALLLYKLLIEINILGKVAVYLNNVFKKIIKSNVNELNSKHSYMLSVVIVSVLHVSLMVLVTISSVYLVNRLVNDNNSLLFALKDYLFLQQPQDDFVSDKFIQSENNTCGPAVLAYLLSYYGKEVLESDLLPYIRITEQGTSMLELKNASKKLGFNAVGLKANLPGLEMQVLPVIAYINSNHYVVINKIVNDFVYLFDPIEGHVKVTKRSFEKIWNGYMLLIKMKPITGI